MKNVILINLQEKITFTFELVLLANNITSYLSKQMKNS